MRAFDLSIPSGYYVETEADARRWITKFLETHRRNGGLGIDSETTGVRRHRDIVIIWSLSDGVDRICLDAKYLPLFKEPILENPDINFDGTNIVFDAHMFANTGVDISKAGDLRNTIVQSWLLNENNQGRHGLKECVRDHFHRETPTFDSVFGKKPIHRAGQPEITVGDLIRAALADSVKRSAAADYASLDAYNSTMLRHHFDALLDKEEMYRGVTLKQHFYEVEVPFTKVLYKMERRGITIDKGHLTEQQPDMQAELIDIEKEFARHAGKIVNLRSPTQLQWFFFEVLGKQPSKFTEGGASGVKKPSTDFEVLDGWAGEGDKYATLLLRHRALAKTHDTYISGLQDWLDQHYRIHTTFNHAGTVTGRLSSSEPNLQNIPRPGEDKFKIREAFIPGKDRVLLVADYEQLELRLMAHFSGDRKMIDAIKRDIDLHCLTVAEIYGFPYEDVMAAKGAEKKAKQGLLELTAEEKQLLLLRQGAKAVGFGIIYGIGGGLLAANLTKDLGKQYSAEEGFELIKKWYNVFPGVKRYIHEVKSQIWRDGYVQTLMGRFRRFGDLKGMSSLDQSMCERQGVNSVIQGTASEVAKMAMLKAEADPELSDLGAELLLQVHDELVWEFPDNPAVIEKAKKRIHEIMEHPFAKDLDVPLPVSVGSGYSWATAK